jgi:hypothetical protein
MKIVPLVVAAVALLLLVGASAAGAETFGGLGSITSIPKAGEGPGEIDVGHPLGFAVEPQTGAFFVAEQIEKETHVGSGNFTEFAVIEKFSSEGTFEGQAEFNIGATDKVHDMTIDPEAKELYLLTVTESGEKFHPQDVYEISTTLTAGKLEAKQLVTKVGEEHFVEPTGIAVDPKTHDVFVLGYVEEKRESFAALQTVHPAGTLGPRYKDAGGCLTGHYPTGEEQKNCELFTEGEEETLGSLAITSGGHILVEAEEEMLWEIPDPEPSEAYKTVTVTPHMRFAFNETTEIAPVRFERSTELEGIGEMAAYEPGASAGEGTLFAAADVGEAVTGHTTSTGVLVFNVTESGSEPPVVHERGWTGGQEEGTGEHKCLIPLPGGPTSSLLLGAGPSDTVAVFDVTFRPSEPEPEKPEFELFGAQPGSEACGHASLTTPAIQRGELKNAKEALAGEAAKLISTLEGAQALEATWTIVAPGGKSEELKSKFTKAEQRLAPSLEHTFATVGEYEVTEKVQTDNLGTPALTVTRKVTVAAQPITFAIEPTAAALVGTPVELKTSAIKDPNEAEAKLTVVWNFGDGTPAVEQKVEGKGKIASVSHTFATAGTPTVTVKVKDAAGAEGSASRGVAITEPTVETHTTPTTTTTTPTTTPKEEHPSTTTKSDPEATIAGSTVSVSSNGAASVTVSCPSSEGAACEGTVMLRTLTAVSASKKKKKAILTLASGSFHIAGGAKNVIVLHLSSKARALLAHSHTLRALAIVTAHDPAGVSKKTETHITLRLVAKKKHH